MSRILSLYLLLCLASFASSQNSSPAASTLPVQVVYVIDGTTILTYDVDPQTLNSTQVGTPLTVKTASTFVALIPSAHDHFLYFVAYDANLNEHLWVYKTDATGAPIAPATQEINATGFAGLRTDPHAPYAYAIFGVPDGTFNTDYYIRRYLVNPATGALSQPKAEAKYVLSNGAEGTTACYLELYGFNPNATTLYDAVGCNGHDGGGITYNERGLNPQDGSLGPDAQIYSWTNGNQGYENVEFVNNLMFDFVQPNGFQQGVNSVNIYPLVPNTSQQLVHCDASMLEACGYTGGVAHPSGKYVFMEISQDSVQVDRVELSQKKIVDTGNYIPFRFGQFSPDGSLVYSTQSFNPGYEIEIYGFDVATGTVTPGGGISVPSGLDPFYVAQRD